MGHKLLMAVLMFGVASPLAFAQEVKMVASDDINGGELQNSVNQDSSAQTSEQQMKAEISQDGLVSLDFRDADIKNVLKVLAYKSGVNIIAGPEVVGVVTIQLKDVPWQRALDVILQTYGYGYEKQGNIIMVTSVANLKQRRDDAAILAEQEPLVTQTFVLKYTTAGEIVPALEKMVTDRGTLNFDQRSNTIILRDVQSNVVLIETVISRLDRITPQVLIEAKVIKTVLTDDETLGIDWSAAFTVSGGARPISFPFKQSSNNTFLYPTFSGDTDVTDPLFQFGSLDASSLQAVFQYLSTRINTETVSNPSIVTVDNKAAKIVVGEEYPIPNYTYSEESGQLQVSGFTWREIGVIFEVTPHVNGDEFITLDIKPQVSTVQDTTVTFDQNSELPRIDVDSAETTVMVRDGATLMIAGLISDRTADTAKKIPILGDIPLLGKLFSQDATSSVKKEIVIFLTPHIITPEATGTHTASK